MKFRMYEGWSLLPVVEFPWKSTHLVSPYGNSNSKPSWCSSRTWTWAYRKDREGFELEWGSSSDWSWHHAVCRHWLKRRASSISWTKNFEDAFFLPLRRLRREMRRFCECFSREAFSDTSKFTVVKQANCHDALSSCCLSRFFAVNNLDHPHVTFNSVQVTQWASKPVSYLPLFQDRKCDFLSAVNWSFKLVSKGKTSM